ncbi:hypothetical protein JTE90_012811 [Oedothorax gibbosus]|uniref:Chitin-binding type-2 domain-containing protein n=1 Tax=Oedothorax gibbosus TaxID=931172 RepID=A0AAV6W274_9ARAC|nr:hypothetical protein JTE90_012811 [Oedothorax gibbosus]
MAFNIPSLSHTLLLSCLLISHATYAFQDTVTVFSSQTCWSPRCPTVVDERKIPRLVPDPTNCRRFFLCNEPLPYLCPENMIFDATSQGCVDQSGCNGGSEVFMTYTSCPKENQKDVVSLPHPTDCTKFYVCDHGKAYLRQCPAKLHYNEDLRVCDYPYKAKCKARLFSEQL